MKRSGFNNKVECYFEKENIWTFDGKGELLLTAERNAPRRTWTRKPSRSFPESGQCHI